MTTFYTASVEDGSMTSLKKFILLCAKSRFHEGMFVDETPPDDQQNEQILRRLQKELNELRKMTDADVAKEAQREFDDWCASVKTSNEIRKLQRERFGAMLEKAKTWEPPTPKHRDLKHFMIKQLTSSLDFVGADRETPTEVEKVDVWRARRLQWKEESIQDHLQKMESEKKHYEETQGWIDSLRKSVADLP